MCLALFSPRLRCALLTPTCTHIRTGSHPSNWPSPRRRRPVLSPAAQISTSTVADIASGEQQKGGQRGNKNPQKTKTKTKNHTSTNNTNTTSLCFLLPKPRLRLSQDGLALPYFF